MRADRRRTAQLGEVIAAAFDQAADYSTNPRKVSRLVTRAVELMMRTPWTRMTSSRWPLVMLASSNRGFASVSLRTPAWLARAGLD